MVPGGSAGGMPGSGGWTGLAFAFFRGRGLAIQRHGRSLARSHASSRSWFSQGPRHIKWRLPSIGLPGDASRRPAPGIWQRCW
jgi:hypothetical protein